MPRLPIVIVSAHPDDSYAVVGTAFLLREKFELHLVDFTHGERGLGEQGYRDGSTTRIRTKEEERATAFLGAKLHWLHEIDGEARSCAEAVNELTALLRDLKPRAIFSHWPIDVHNDHVNCSAATQTAAALADVSEFYFFEEPFVQTKLWQPTYSVDISSVFEKAMTFMRMYECQGAHYLKPAQAEIRGGQHWPKVRYAETFTTFDGKRIKGGVLESLEQTVLLNEFNLDNGRLVIARRDAEPVYGLVIPESDVYAQKAATELERFVIAATGTGFSPDAVNKIFFESDSAYGGGSYRIFAQNGNLHIVSYGEGFMSAVCEFARRFSGLPEYIPGESAIWMEEFIIPDNLEI